MKLGVGPLAIHVAIHGYGAIVAVAVLASTAVFARGLARRRLVSAHWAFRVLPILIGSALVGAKLAGIVDDLDRFRADPLAYLVDPAGHAFLGGVIAGCGALWFLARRRGLPLPDTFDALAPGLLVGWAIGRIACHVTGDGCYGIPFAYGVRYLHGSVPSSVAVHPTPLYESAAALAGLWLLARRRCSRPGEGFAATLVYYGVVRFAIEFLRRNPHIGPLTQSQWTVLVLLGGCALWYRRHPRPGPGPTPTAGARAGGLP